MSRELNPAQIWSQVPLANRTASVIKKLVTATGASFATNISNPAYVDLTLDSSASVDVTKCVRVYASLQYMDVDALQMTAGTNNGAYSIFQSATSVRVQWTPSGTAGALCTSGCHNYRGFFQGVEFY